MLEFDPFSPDKYINEIIVESTEKSLPISMVNSGYTGGNMSPTTEAEIEQALETRRVGRMSLFSTDRVITVVETIEDGGTLQDAAKSIGVSRRTIWAWMQLSPAFLHSVQRAREHQGNALAEDAKHILDEVVLDPENPKSAMAELRKAEQRARIRMDLAKCFNFKQYGDKKQNMNLNVNAEVEIVDLSKYGM